MNDTQPTDLMVRATQSLRVTLARGTLRVAISLVSSVAISSLCGQSHATTPTDAQETAKSDAALPAHLPLWAYGYKEQPTTRVDFRAKCATGRPIDCVRGTVVTDLGELDSVHTLEGSRRSFSLRQVWDMYGPADWYPEDHPPMPDIVAHGRKEAGIPACAGCHLPNGKGLMQNGGVAGLPADYTLRQLQDYKSGRRQSADTNKSNAFAMMAIARQLSDAEMAAAANYFSAVKPRPWIRVVESAVVPRFKASINGLFTKVSEETEPLGRRLIEMPEDTIKTAKLRSPRSGYVAYAPIGSLKRGEMLVRTGNAMSGATIQEGRTVACGACHGNDLRGTSLGPPIAGRSPSYLARQLVDYKSGARAGEMAVTMMPTVANLTEDDLIAIVAYVASLPP
jgi:cytochrome c553